MEDYSQFDTNELNEVLEANRDPYRKEIGDRVQVIDFSSVTDLNGEDPDNTVVNFNTKLIVIATNQTQYHDALFKQYLQNMIVVCPVTNKQYRVNSGHLKLI